MGCGGAAAAEGAGMANVKRVAEEEEEVEDGLRGELSVAERRLKSEAEEEVGAEEAEAEAGVAAEASVEGVSASRSV